MSAFASLFVPDELQEAVSGRSWLEALLESESALARAGARVGVVPATAAAAIVAACRDGDYDWEVLLHEGRAVGTPVEPLVRALVARVDPESGNFVHLGATSQDIMDTAAMLVTRRALSLVLADLTRVADACASLSLAHRDTPIAGRTLLQQAAPTTFGLKTAGWLVAVLDARARLLAQHAEALVTQLGGAVGTLAAFGEHGPEIARLYALELGLGEAAIPWHSNRLRIGELGAALGLAARVMAKIGLDVQLLAQTEVGEVREGGAGGGSSAMPHKRNAVGSMSARACAALARGHALVLADAIVQEHERAAGGWQAEWDSLSGVLAATGGAAASIATALEGLDVDVARMRANLELTEGQVVSERVAMILTGRLGRTAARALAREAAVRAGASGRPFRAELADLDTDLTAQEIDAALQPEAFLGSAGLLVDRALARYSAEGDASPTGREDG